MVDNSTEFVNSDLQNFLKFYGITFCSSVPYTHQQNGIAGREIHTITKGVRAMLYVANLPKWLWSVAVKTMAYLWNRPPNTSKQWDHAHWDADGESPNLVHLRIFGTPVSVAVPKEKRQKWGSGLRMSYMVGCKPYKTGYLMCVRV